MVQQSGAVDVWMKSMLDVTLIVIIV